MLLQNLDGLVLKVAAHQQHHVVAERVAAERAREGDEAVDVRAQVVAFQPRVVHHGHAADAGALAARAAVGPAQPVGRAVDPLRERPGEHFGGGAERRAPSPHELHRPVAHAPVAVLVVDPPDVKRVEARFRAQQRGLRRGVAKRVEVPADARHDAELALQPALPVRRLIDHRCEVEAALVVLRPPAVHEHKLLVGDEPPHERARGVVLLQPPPLEVSLLGKRPRAGRVAEQLREDGVERVLHARILGQRAVRAVVVLIGGLEPADVQVRVRHEVYSDRRGRCGGAHGGHRLQRTKDHEALRRHGMAS